MADLNATSQASLDALLTKLGAKKSDTSAATTPKSQLGQQDFLKLMTTQLQNQDPFQPQSNDQMIAQMAQFSTVSGITQLNTTMSNVATEISTNSIATLANIIGKTVLVPGNVAMPDDTGAISGAVDLPTDATDLTVQITKPSGELVKSLSLGANSSGLVGFQWDGTDSSGKPVRASSYNIKALMTAGGKQSAANTDVYAPITQLNVPHAGEQQTISVAGLGNLKMTDIRAYKY